MADNAGALDLSALKGKDQDAVAFDALSPEDQEALAKMAEDNPEPEGEPVRTAFLVIVGKDGSTGVMPDLDFPVVRDYLPTLDDIFGAVTTVAKDIQVQETAMGTAQAMQQMAHAQMQAMQNQRLAQGLQLGGH
jgi:hypothetical protein